MAVCVGVMDRQVECDVQEPGGREEEDEEADAEDRGNPEEEEADHEHRQP